jgi:hypothetical protein
MPRGLVLLPAGIEVSFNWGRVGKPSVRSENLFYTPG